MPVLFRLIPTVPLHARRLAAWALLCLLAVSTSAMPDVASDAIVEVAAFGVSPVLAPAGKKGDEDARSVHATRLARGDTWPGILRRLLTDDPDVDRYVAALARVDLPEPTPGRYARLGMPEKGALVVVDYLDSANSAYRLRITRHATEVLARLPDDDLVRAARQDEMKNSLFAATDAVGLPEEIALRLVDIFAEEVDFLRELGQGYRCALVYEMDYVDGVPRPGRILAAELSHGGRPVTAYWHRFGNGDHGYFKPDGTDINRVLRPETAVNGTGKARLAVVDASASFRRSPLEFSRVTSAPAALRYHPILKEWRAHRGIDYGAPIGTKVKATADGEVYFAGTRGSYGNLVILRHYDRFSTFYGHLNGFANGLSVGDKVRKGEVIGYVGMTGLATGPHLHYELHDALAPGRLYTPLVVRAIGADELPMFQATMARLRAQLDHAYRANMVMLD
jgi:murein DD-endopeptidase MepM/ murein hydrolase activator NlpD